MGLVVFVCFMKASSIDPHLSKSNDLTLRVNTFLFFLFYPQRTLPAIHMQEVKVRFVDKPRIEKFPR